jgi:hypothetical protein
MVAALSRTNRCSSGSAYGAGEHHSQIAAIEVSCHSAHTPAAAWMSRCRQGSSSAAADST